MSTLLPTIEAPTSHLPTAAAAAPVQVKSTNVMEFSANSSNGFTVATTTNIDSRSNSLLGTSILAPQAQDVDQALAASSFPPYCPTFPMSLAMNAMNEEVQREQRQEADTINPIIAPTTTTTATTTSLLQDMTTGQVNETHQPVMDHNHHDDLDIESNHSRLTIDNDFFTPLAAATAAPSSTKLLVDADDQEVDLKDRNNDSNAATPIESHHSASTAVAGVLKSEVDSSSNNNSSQNKTTSKASINKDGYVIDDKCHLNYAWPSYDAVKYSSARPGRQLSVTQPNHAGPIEVYASETVLFTKGVGVAMQIGDAASLSKCAHFHYNGRCIRGKGCSFVHAITIDKDAKPGQMAPLMLSRTTKGSVVPAPARRPERRSQSTSNINTMGAATVTRDVIPAAPDYLTTTTRTCPQSIPMPPDHHHQQALPLVPQEQQQQQQVLVQPLQQQQQPVHPIHQQQLLRQQQQQQMHAVQQQPSMMAAPQQPQPPMNSAVSSGGVMWVPVGQLQQQAQNHHQQPAAAPAGGYFLVPAGSVPAPAPAPVQPQMMFIPQLQQTQAQAPMMVFPTQQ